MRRLLSLAKPFFASVTSRRGFLKTAMVGVTAWFFSGIRAHAKRQPTLQRSAGISADPSFSRFTDRARKVMRLADEEARRLRHEYLGTEHILLGLGKEGSGVAANVLINLGVDLQKTRIEVENIIHVGPECITGRKLPQTPRAKRLLQFAMEEARWLAHNFVGTEHLLLAVVRVPEGVAGHVLRNHDLELSQVRKETRDLLGVDLV